MFCQVHSVHPSKRETVVQSGKGALVVSWLAFIITDRLIRVLPFSAFQVEIDTPTYEFVTQRPSG